LYWVVYWGVVGGATPSPQRGGREGGLSRATRRLCASGQVSGHRSKNQPKFHVKDFFHISSLITGKDFKHFSGSTGSPGEFAKNPFSFNLLLMRPAGLHRIKVQFFPNVRLIKIARIKYSNRYSLIV
jgi:hypothetical protein